MVGTVGLVISWSSAITLVSLTAAIWSGLIDAFVPEPYLVSIAPKCPNNTHAVRMRFFILGKHKPISAVNGMFGTPSLRLLLACGFH